MKELTNQIVIHQKTEEIEYLQFRKLLELGIKHAYSLKREGLNFRTNSKEETESYHKLCKSIGIKEENRVKPCQRHTSTIQVVTKPMKVDELPDTDGLITNVPFLPLVTTNADCILLLFYDPKKKVIANIHSGWKGTYQRISEELVQKMISEFHSDPADILCFICPSIRKCHFEVDFDVKEMFEKEFQKLGNKDAFISMGKRIEGKQKYNIDTVFITKELLKLNGIKQENIYDSGICSVCHSDLIRSYRVEKEEYQLATAIIQMG